MFVHRTVRYDTGNRTIAKTILSSESTYAAGVNLCGRICQDEPICRGFTLVDLQSGGFECFTVNDTVRIVKTSLTCTSYTFVHNASCHPTCGPGDGDGMVFAGIDPSNWRPIANVNSGGLQECELACNRIQGCKGFVVDSSGGDFCFPVNDTTTTQATPFPYVSYEKNGPAVLANTIIRADAEALSVWVAPPTAHIFADDVGSSFCSADGKVASSIDLAGAPGMTVAAQIAVRVPVGAGRNRVDRTTNAASALALFTINVQLEALVLTSSRSSGNITNTKQPTPSTTTLPTSAISVRQVGFVYAPQPGPAIYRSERGTGWYPDMLARCAFSAEIYTRGCHWIPRLLA
jgi:hypothetical protein